MSDSITINVTQEASSNIVINDTGENIYLNPLTLNQGVINHSVTHQSGGSDELSHNLLGGLNGGQSGQYYHISSGQYFNLTTGDVVRPSQTGNFITASQTGAFYPKSNPSGFITGVDLSNYVTGAVVRPSETGAFYPASNPSGFITGLDTSAYVTGAVVRPYETGLFLTTEIANLNYVNLTGQQIISGIKSFENAIYAPIIYGQSLTGESITINSDAFIINCDLDMNNNSIKNVSTNSISFFNSGDPVTDAIISLGSEIYDGSLYDYVFSFDKNLKVKDRIVSLYGDQYLSLVNSENATNGEYLGYVDKLIKYENEILFIKDNDSAMPINTEIISFGEDSLFPHIVTHIGEFVSGRAYLKIEPSITPEEILYLFNNGANGSTDIVRGVSVYRRGLTEMSIVNSINDFENEE